MQNLKGKRKNKSKAELLAEAEHLKEVDRQRRFVKDILYPFLIEYSDNIEDAQQMLRKLEKVIADSYGVHMNKASQALNEEWSNKLVPSIEMVSMMYQIILDKKVNKKLKAMLHLFDNEKLNTTSALLGGLNREITRLISVQDKDRKLGTLKTDFL